MVDFDGLLASLGVEVGKTEEDIPPAAKPAIRTRLRIAQRNGGYIVHCFRGDVEVTESELEGALLKEHWTYPTDLQTFSEKYENALQQIDVLYHRTPPVPVSETQAIVSYRLVNRANDPTGKNLLGTVEKLNNYIFTHFF